jgi:hypothetical protein
LILINLCRAGYGLLAASLFRHPQEAAMFFDEVVISGILIVGLCVVFVGGFAAFIWKDAHKPKAK